MLATGRLLTLAALLALCGGHWALFQGIAWTGMLVEYSARDGFLSGVQKTFDGEHPCQLCEKIEQERATESQFPEFKVSLSDLKAVVPTPSVLPARRAPGAMDFPGWEAKASALASSPPGPPPRA